MTASTAAHPSPQPLQNPSFQASDPDLPLLAARAAAQVDRILRNEPVGAEPEKPVFDALESFGKLVANLGKSGAEDAVRNLLDPVSSKVFRSASVEANLVPNIGTYTELALAVQNLNNLLDRISAGQSPSTDDLIQLRTFFIYLSDFAASELQSYSTMPYQPYRR